MESKYFIYDGIKSLDMGVYLVRIDGGMVESPFYGGATVKEQSLINRIKPYYFGIEREMIEFTITISPLDKEWTPELRNRIGQWLFKNEFKAFQSSSDLGKIYYAMPISAPNFELYSSKGYIEIEMITNSAYAWSPVYYDVYDLQDNKNKTTIILDNKSNINKPFYPKIEVKNTSGKTFKVNEKGEKEYLNQIKLKNLSNKGKETIIEGFESKDELISIDNENEIILSDLYDSKPFKRFNREWLELVYGENEIEVEGECIIWTKMQFPILQ